MKISIAWSHYNIMFGLILSHINNLVFNNKIVFWRIARNIMHYNIKPFVIEFLLMKVSIVYTFPNLNFIKSCPKLLFQSKHICSIKIPFKVDSSIVHMFYFSGSQLLLYWIGGELGLISDRTYYAYPKEKVRSLTFFLFWYWFLFKIN